MTLAHFAPEAELVLAGVVGNDVGQHACDVVAAGGIGDSHLFKSADQHARRTEDGLPVNELVRAGEQPTGVPAQAMVGVVERLIELIHAKHNQPGHPRAEASTHSPRAFPASTPPSPPFTT